MLHIHDVNLPFLHIHMYSVGLKSGACGGHVSSERTVMLKKQDYLNLNRHYINKIELNRHG